jgi:hypothetical protein
VIRINRQNENKKNNKIIYSEWVPAGKFVKTVILFVCLLILSLGIIISAFRPEELGFIDLIFGSVSLLIFLIYWNYRGLKITLSTNHLEVKYGVFNHKTIALGKITSCDITKAYFRIYGGVGIRFGLDGSIAYNTDFGDAVKLTFHNGRPFLFSTKHPEKICNLINESII